MERLLKAARVATAADIQRAAIDLERSREVREGNKRSRSASRVSQAGAAERRAAQQDSPLTW